MKICEFQTASFSADGKTVLGAVQPKITKEAGQEHWRCQKSVTICPGSFLLCWPPRCQSFANALVLLRHGQCSPVDLATVDGTGVKQALSCQPASTTVHGFSPYLRNSTI